MSLIAAAPLVEAVLKGDRLALARVLTQVENQTRTGQQALDALFPHGGRAHLVGITGAPGTGKSSLTNQLARAFRQPHNGSAPRRVGVVAVDPSSPFTGGAVLGDRVRMRDLTGDPGVFVRSMASRGALGGLARTTAAMAQVLDAAGYDIILIETVGAGQSEVDIARLAHTTVVVEAPGMGDDIQAIKAGILEIADILVVNKADHPGVENTERALRSMLELADPSRRRAPLSWEQPLGDPCKTAELPTWQVPVLLTVATQTKGAPEVADAILRHGQYLRETGLWHERECFRLRAELTALLQAGLMQRWRSRVSDEMYDRVMDRLLERKLSPSQAVRLLIDPEG